MVTRAEDRHTAVPSGDVVRHDQPQIFAVPAANHGESPVDSTGEEGHALALRHLTLEGRLFECVDARSRKSSQRGS